MQNSPCALGTAPPSSTPEVTFVKDGRLLGIRRIGAEFVERCLAQLTPSDTGAVSWGPQGDRFLIGNATFVVGDRRAATDFGANDVASWSAPKGTAILRLDPIKHHVSKRDHLGDGTITSLPVMSEAYDALYHPAGRNIAVVGRNTPSSVYGIWLITNDGRNPKLITSAIHAKKLRLLHWDNGGRELTFWAEHFDGDTYVHTLTLPGLGLSGGETDVPANLADLERNAPQGVVTGSCAAGTLKLSVRGTRFPVATHDARLVSGTGVSTFVATRASTCDGPEDLWAWPPSGAPFKVAEGVTTAVVREVADSPFELPADITARAPG
jgi:hypothetical protein